MTDQTPKRDISALTALALANIAANFPVPAHVQEALDVAGVDLKAEQAAIDARAAAVESAEAAKTPQPQKPPKGVKPKPKPGQDGEDGEIGEKAAAGETPPDDASNPITAPGATEPKES